MGHTDSHRCIMTVMLYKVIYLHKKMSKCVACEKIIEATVCIYTHKIGVIPITYTDIIISEN